LECSGANPLFFDYINDTNVNVKLTGSFIKAYEEGGQIIGLRDNLFILNKDNFEPNKPDPDYKSNGILSLTTQEINTASPLLITVRDTYFLLDQDKSGIRYIANESLKQILPPYYEEVFNDLNEKESAYWFNDFQEYSSHSSKY
jgi:hypothetical protein